MRDIFDCQEGGVHIRNKISVMDYQQYRRARKLVHECCNYDNGNCIALDEGEEYMGSPQSRMTLWEKEEQRIFEGTQPAIIEMV